MSRDDCAAATPSRWLWFALGLAAGELLGVLSLHFLTRPGVPLNWPVVAVGLIGVAALVLIAWRLDVH